MARRVRQPRSRSSRRPNRAGVRLVLVVGMFVGVVAVGGAWWQQREPIHTAHPESRRLGMPPAPPSTASQRGSRGEPLRGPTGLRLLVADAPAPFVLDVYRGTIRRITGLPADGKRGVTIAPVGRHALVLSQRLCAGCPPLSNVYLVRHDSTFATPLGSASQAVPSRNGDSVWILRRRDPRRCAIARIGLDGRRRLRARQVSCRTGLVAELPAGLLIEDSGTRGRDAHNALLAPGGRVIRLPYQQARPLVGNLVLIGAYRRAPLLLRDVRSGAVFRLRWPSRSGYGLGEATGAPTGRLALVEFAKYSPEHRLDMWLLDAVSRRWRHLPGMPAKLIPKATDVKWTADGGVVVLSGDLLAVWRPGEPRLATHRVPPPRQPGSQFLIW